MKKKCSKCGDEKELCEFNKDNRPSASFHRRPECRECGKKIRDEYYSDPSIKKKQEVYIKEYIKNNINKVRTRRNRWFKRKTKEEILFKLSRNLRNRIYKFIKNKSHRTEEIIGIDYELFKNYLESKFQEGMSWENYGEWQIDHKIPLSSGKNEYEIIKLCHYSNLQPLWKLENIKKSNKITW